MTKFVSVFLLVVGLWFSPGARAMLMYPGGTNFNILDAADRGCNTKGQCSKGMVTWSVSEPYLNLWLADTPVSYTTSLGEDIAFQVFYKQRDTTPPHVNRFQQWYLTRNGFPPDMWDDLLQNPPPAPQPYVPSTGWNHNWFSYVRFSGTYHIPAPGATGVFTNFWQDFSSWKATLFVAGGGQIDFNGGWSYEPADVPNQPNVTGCGLQPMAVNANGDSIYPATTNGFTIVPNGGPNVPGLVGFRLVHADGSMDLYGRVTPVYPNTAVADALLTEHVDASGNSTHFYYTNKYVGGTYCYFLAQVVDYDGKTNFLTYNASNLLARVDLPYGRYATFDYDQRGNLTNITDAVGLQSQITYQPASIFGSVDEPVTLTTPYGVTQFELVDNGSDQEGTEVGNAGGTNRINRAVQVTLPDNSKELFLYRFDSRYQGVPGSVGDFPVSPINPMLDNTNDVSNTNVLLNLTPLYTRNSFHWGRRQAALLSTNVLTALTTNDYRFATMTHWLARDPNHLSDTRSMIQAPSPDGTQPGARTWFDSSGKAAPWFAGNGVDTAVCQLLPNGDTRYVRTVRNGLGLPQTIASTYEQPDGTVDFFNPRTLTYQYESLLGTETCSVSSSQISSATWNFYTLSTIYGPESETLVSLSAHSNETTPHSIGAYDFETTRPQRRELTVTDAESRTATAWYNSRQQVTGARGFNEVLTTNVYGSDGWLTKSINLSAGATNSLAFTNGLLMAQTNALGLVTTYAWDDLERLLTVRFPDNTGVTNFYDRLNLGTNYDRLGQWTRYTPNALGQVTNVLDSAGRRTQVSYCSCGSVDTVTDPVNGSTTHNYDPAGRLSSEVDSDAFTTTYVRNPIGQITNVTDSAGNSLNVFYNHQGLIKQVSNATGTLYQAVFDIHDRPIQMTHAYGAVVTNTYDHLDRLLTRTLINGGQTSVDSYTHNDFGLESHTDAEQRVTTYGYDAAGRLFAVTNANLEVVLATFNRLGQRLTLTDGRNKTTRWAYDEYGRTLAETNANNVLVRTNAYDANGQLTKSWTPAKGLTSYYYDAAGNLTNLVSANRNVAVKYDALGRATNLTDSAGTVARSYASWGAFAGALATEDGPWASDTITVARSARRLSTLTLAQPSGGNRSWSFGYDGLNRLRTLNGNAGNFTFDYAGAAGRLIATHLPGGNLITNWFDPAGQLLHRALKTAGSTVLDVFDYTHDLTGLRTNVLRGDGTHVEYAFDGIGQLTNAVAFEPGGALRRNEDFQYAYDAGGNLQTRVNHTLTQTFGVDAANRLTNATRSGTLTAAGAANSLAITVTVNGLGTDLYTDRTFATTNGLTLDDGTNVLRFTATGGTSTTVTQVFHLPATVRYAYDLNGNLTSDCALGYDYDDADRLIRITKTNEWKSEFGYDPLGRRNVRREYNWSPEIGDWALANETRYVWLGMSVLQERDANNAVKVTYTRGLDLSGTMEGAGGIGGLLAREDAALGDASYFFSDGNGNVSSLIDSAGSIKAKYRYDSFGNLLSKNGPLADVNLIRFSGKEIHQRSGLYYYGFRYYAPNLQRWLNEDPIRQRGGVNLYQAFANSPINVIDPDGRDNMYNPGAGQNAPVNFGFSMPTQGGPVASEPLGTDPMVSTPLEIAPEAVGYAASTFGSMIPSVGEYQDLCVIEDPDAPAWQKGLASLSLALSMASEGFLPNAGPFLKNFKKTKPDCPDTLNGGNKIDSSKISSPPPERGKAPIGDDGKPVELHHRDQTKGNDSPLDEMTRTDHRGAGNYKKNHPNTGQNSSTVDRTEFDNMRESHWEQEWDSGRFDGL